MNKDERYEVNSHGELVIGIPQVCSDRKQMIEQLFSRNGWGYELVDEISQAHYVVKLSNPNTEKSYRIQLFHGNVRKEDPDRNRAEKKIQLGGLDPRQFADEMCIILGVYIYDSNAIDDAIIVAWPVEMEKNYPNNPSLRVNMKQDILPAKNNGIYFDRTTGKNIVVFKPEFIYYYLEHYKELHDIGVPTEVEQGEEYSAEWFAAQAELLKTFDDEAEELYHEFLEHFAPEKLQQLSGTDLLDKIFLSNNKADKNLCQTLEYDSKYSLFGSISGGNASKYGLYFSHSLNAWVTGGPKSLRSLTLEEAIALGTQMRDELVAGAAVISEFGEPTDLNGYAELYARLFKVMPNLINKMWVLKYFHMIFPRVFPVFYNAKWQNLVLEKVNIEPQEDAFVRMGQIALFAKECGITNVMFSKVVDKIERRIEATPDDEEAEITIYDFNTTCGGAHNKVIYGTPGCGKSYYVDKVLLPKMLKIPKENIFRTTFFQDYTNTDFVGQILPKVQSDKSVMYEFNPGPFTLALKKAIEKPDELVALVIEELNRGNAPSIFGDIFQLLDRKAEERGRSEYDIVNVNIQDYLNKCFEEQGIQFNSIRIPANLYIIATMNTSDQNVFTLDTAFKRRWQFEKIRNEFDASHKYKGYFVPGMDGMTWEQLVNGINAFILSRADGFSSEDKLVGVYFIGEDTLCEKLEDSNDEAKKKRFAYKLFEYLWDDVAKFAREDWFGSEIKSLDQLIDAYMANGKAVMRYVIKLD